MKRTALLIGTILLSFSLHAAPAGFQQEDRERLVRLEVKVEEGRNAIQKQLDDLKVFIYWGFGILFGGMGLMIGFVIREYARKEPKLAHALKAMHLL